MTPANDNRRAVAGPAGHGWVFALVAGVVVLSSVGAGLAVIDPPWVVREQALDEGHAQVLNIVSQAIETYHKVNGKLPISLTDLLASPRINLGGFPAAALADIEYKPGLAGSNGYTLCAMFNRPSETKPDTYAQHWQHAAGHTCFALTTTDN